MRRSGNVAVSAAVLSLSSTTASSSSSYSPLVSDFRRLKSTITTSAPTSTLVATKPRKVPHNTPTTAVKEVEKNFLGEEPTWEPSSVGSGGAGSTAVDVDAIPLGIKIPWGDVQRQLQIFISNSLTDPKAVNKGRIFLRDFDVLSNVTTIDEGLELLYYMDRLNYPANSRLELNLLSWLTDNVDCIYVDHVLDVCKFALEQSSVGFWKRTILCNDWFLPRLERLVRGRLQSADDLHDFTLLKKSATTGEKQHAADTATSQAEEEGGARGDFALEDLVLISRVLSGTGGSSANGDDAANITGDKSTSNNSSVRSGRDGSSSSSNSNQFNVSISASLTQDVATIQRRLRPVTEALTETAVRLITTEMKRIRDYHQQVDTKTAAAPAAKKVSSSQTKKKALDVSGDVDEVTGEDVAALNDFFHSERNDDSDKASGDISSSTTPPKFLLNPLLLSNVVTFILPLESGEQGKDLKKLMYAIFDDASAIDCMVYLSALASSGVLDTELINVLTSRMVALSANQLIKWSGAEGTAPGLASAGDVDAIIEKKRKGVKKGALTRATTAVSSSPTKSTSILNFQSPNIVFKLHRDDATVDTVYISKALMLIMRLTSTSAKLGGAPGAVSASSQQADDGNTYLFENDDVEGAVTSVMKGGSDASTKKSLIEVSSFLNDVNSPPMQLLSQLEQHLSQRQAFFERVRREREVAQTSSERAREVAMATGTVDADLIQAHLDKIIDAVDAIEYCGRYCRIAEAAAGGAEVGMVASIDGVYGSNTTPATPKKDHQRGSNPGGIASKQRKSSADAKNAAAAADAAANATAVAAVPAAPQALSSPMSLTLLRLENHIETFVSQYGLGCQHASVLGHCLRIGSKLGASGSGAGTGFLKDQLIQRCEELSTSIASSPVMQQAGFLSGNPAGSTSVSTPAVPPPSVIEREFKMNFDTTLRIVEGLAALGTFPAALVECSMAVLIDKRSQLLPSDVATMVYVAGKASKTARIEPELIHQLCHRLLTFAKFSRRGGDSSSGPTAASNTTLSSAYSGNRYQVASAPVSWDNAISVQNDGSVSSRHRSFQRSSAAGSGTLSPNEVAMLLYGLAAANITPDVKLQAYLGELTVGAMDAFTGSECCALLLVVHQLKLQHSALGRAVGQEVASAVPRLVPEDLIRVAQVMGELGLRDVRLMTSIVNRLRQCKSLVQPIHLVSIAIALRETGFSPLFSRCGLEDVLREIDFLLPNQATYLLAFVSPASQEFLLKRFVRTEQDLRKLTVDSLLTVYSAETDAVAPIRTHVLSLLEGKVAPATFPPEVASVALSKAVALSNDSQQAFHNLTHLIDFIGPLAHRFQHTHTISLVDTVRRCIAESIPESAINPADLIANENEDGSVAIVSGDVVSKSDRVATLEGATFKVHSAVYRFLGRRVVAIVDTMSAEQCISALEIYCHGKIRDDRVVKAIFKRLSKFARSITSSPRLTRSCVKLCEFYGAGWTSGLYAALKLNMTFATSSNKLMQYKGVR